MSTKARAVDAWEALFRAQVSVLRDLHDDFPSDEISFNEYDVLFNLSRCPGRKTRIRDLNQYLLLTQPSVSRLVDRLVGRGLVSKETDSTDGRGTIVCLTDEGYALFRRVALVHVEAINKRVGGRLTESELGTLTRLSQKLRGTSE